MCSYVFCNKKDARPLFQGWITFWQTDRLIFYAVRKTRTDAKLHSDEANKNSFTFDRTLKLKCILAFNADIFLVKDTWDNQIKNINETNINLGKAITSFKDIEENI